ncbi:hypothetical protein [Streptomyces sp. NPDC101166]|uniref:hypothetical protein n=1 Tax=Streptomyces sp. NPDC101166 TaxID=3366120 RepID=UPI00382E5FA5
MTAGAYAHPTISRFAIADGMLRIGGPSVGLLAERAGATPFFTYRPAATDLDVLGFHVLSGSQNVYADVLSAAHGRNADLVVRLGDPAAETVSVGCLCTLLDVLARDVRLPRAEIGDLVAVFQARSYGITASPTAFLGHPMPTEVMVQIAGRRVCTTDEEKPYDSLARDLAGDFRGRQGPRGGHAGHRGPGR